MDTELSARAFQLAAYIAVWRYNHQEEKAWPSHRRVREDLGLKSEKTVQRLIKELDGKWFDVKRGNGLKHSTEYVPTKETHLAAQELREHEEREKPDNIVRLQATKGGHFCPKTRSKMSREPRQKCPPKKENEKTKEKYVRALDLIEKKASQPARRQPCPVSTLIIVPSDDLEKVSAWNSWLSDRGFPSLNRLSIEGAGAEGSGYLMPRRWVPTAEADQEMIAGYVQWAMDQGVGN